VNGRRVRESKTFTKKADAVRWRNKRIEDGPAMPGTFGEWLSTWLELHKANSAPTNYATDRQTAERHVRPGLGTVKLRDLSKLRCEQWLARLKEKGVSQGERHKCGRTLRKVLRSAHDNGQIPAVPRFKVPGRLKPDTHALDESELGRLVAAAEGRGRWAAVLVGVWADAGLRPGELLGLQRHDWDGGRRKLHVRRAVCKVTGALKETKTESSRRAVLLSAPTAAALDGLLAARPGAKPTDPIFPAARGGHWVLSNFATKVFRPLVRAAGVKATPKTLRHTMATLLLQSGVPLKVVSERLGHKDPALTLRVYQHVMSGDQERAADRMGEILTRLRLPHANPHDDKVDVRIK
jgi:integrase